MLPAFVTSKFGGANYFSPRVQPGRDRTGLLLCSPPSYIFISINLHLLWSLLLPFFFSLMSTGKTAVL